MVPASLDRVGAGLAPAWKNQRATVRYRCAPATPGRVLLTEDNEYQRGWVLDLSLSGLGLHLARQLEPGVLAFIFMTGALTKRPYELTAHVAHGTRQLNGEWIVGLEFVDRLTDDELEDLLA